MFFDPPSCASLLSFYVELLRKRTFGDPLENPSGTQIDQKWRPKSTKYPKKLPKPQRCNCPFADVFPKTLREHTLRGQGAHTLGGVRTFTPKLNFGTGFGKCWHESGIGSQASPIGIENQSKLNCRELGMNFQTTGNGERSPRSMRNILQLTQRCQRNKPQTTK